MTADRCNAVPVTQKCKNVVKNEKCDLLLWKNLYLFLFYVWLLWLFMSVQYRESHLFKKKDRCQNAFTTDKTICIQDVAPVAITAHHVQCMAVYVYTVKADQWWNIPLNLRSKFSPNSGGKNTETHTLTYRYPEFLPHRWPAVSAHFVLWCCTSFWWRQSSGPDMPGRRWCLWAQRQRDPPSEPSLCNSGFQQHLQFQNRESLSGIYPQKHMITKYWG